VLRLVLRTQPRSGVKRTALLGHDGAHGVTRPTQMQNAECRMKNAECTECALVSARGWGDGPHVNVRGNTGVQKGIAFNCRIDNMMPGKSN